MIKYLILLIIVLFLLDFVLKNKFFKNIKFYFNFILKKIGLLNNNSIDNSKNKKNIKQKNNDLIKNKENNGGKLNIKDEISNLIKKLENNINLPLNVSLLKDCSLEDKNNIIFFINKNLKSSDTVIKSPIKYCINNYDYSNIYEIKNFIINTNLKFKNINYNCDIELNLVFIPSKKNNIFIHDNIFLKLNGLFKIDNINLLKININNENNTNNANNAKNVNNANKPNNSNNANANNSNNVNNTSNSNKFKIDYNISKKEVDVYEPDSEIITTNSTLFHDIALV